MNKITIIILILIAPIAVSAFDIPVGRQIGLGGGVLLSSPHATDMLSAPTGAGFDGQALFSAGYIRQFELSDLDRVYAAGGYRYKNLTAYIGFSQLGRPDYYVEQIIRGTLGYNYNELTASLLVSSKIVEIGDSEGKIDLSATGFGFAVGINHDKYHFSIVGNNLNNPTLDESRDGENKTLGVFGEIEGPSSFSLLGKLALEENEKAVYSIGQYFHLPNNNALFLGIQSDPIMYGGGLDISYAGFGITYAANYHTDLGLTHSISLTYGLGDPDRRGRR